MYTRLLMKYFPIKNNEQYYINEFGEIASTKSNKILKPSLSTNGYLTVGLNRKMLKVHRLVAETYLDNPDGLPMVDHVDGNKLNNHYTNLRWCTHQQNCDWACDLRMTQSDPSPKGIYLDDVYFSSTYQAAKWLCVKYGKSIDTVRRELRREKRVTIYGHRIRRGNTNGQESG